jgi:hypothetical protein
MKFAYLAAVSSMAIFACGHVGAQVYLTGSSSSQPAVIAALKVMCPGPNNFTVYIPTADSRQLERMATYGCSGNYIGTSIRYVYHNVSGGSLTAVISATPSSVVSFVNPLSCGAPALHTPGGAPSPLDGTIVAPNCLVLVPPRASDGGFLDGPLTMPRAVTLLGSWGYTSLPATNTIPVPGNGRSLSQTFGIAVSDDLYVLLYRQQYGSLITADCTCPLPTDPAPVIVAAYNKPHCQPSVSRLMMQEIMSGTSTAKNGGTSIFNFGTPSYRLTLCRRPISSGTQHVAEDYFLAYQSSIGGDFLMSTSQSKIEVAFSGTKFAALAGSTTTDAINCLGGRNQDTSAGADGSISTTNVYRIGIVSGERVADPAYLPSTTSKPGNWKFVRLNGTAITEGTLAATNTFMAIPWAYDLTERLHYYVNPQGSNANVAAPFVAAVAATMGTQANKLPPTSPPPAPTPGLFPF